MRETIADILIAKKERGLQRLIYFKSQSGSEEYAKKSAMLLRQTIFYFLYMIMFTVMIIMQLDNQTVSSFYF